MKRGLALAVIALLAVPASAAVGPAGVWTPNDRIDAESTPTDGIDAGVSADRAAVDVGVSAVQTGTNATNATRTRLSLPGATRHNDTRLSLDLGSTIAVDDDELASAYQSQVDNRRLFQAAERGRLTEEMVDRIETRIDSLRARERAATVAYANGEISDREFARRLALVATDAEDLGDRLQALKGVTDRRDTALRIGSLSSRPSTFTGRAHEQFLAGLRGGNASSVSIAASEDGYVLQLLDRSEGTYYRQGFRFDNRDPGGTVTLERTDQAFDRLRELYPETATDSVFIPSVQREAPAGLYAVNVNYPEGSATVYLDAATTNVFYEVRQMNLDAMPRTTARNETTAGIRVVVERTFPNGPALVTTVDAETGTPIDADVAIDDRRIGEAGADGKRWFVAPPGGYELSISRGETAFNVTVPSA